jgi:heme-degrading monooxygenase HmoA
MFIHAVLFEIKPGEVKDYRKDSIMWANYAKKHSKGFIDYHTMERTGAENQYVSVYKWKTKNYHDAFMKEFHDFLVSKSKAKVKPLGYYNLKEMDTVS